MADEIGTILGNAMQEWDFAGEKDDISSYKNAEGLFLLALKKAGKPLPRVHSFLAMLYYDLAISYSKRQDRNAAKFSSEAANSATKHADIALQNEHLEFRAQLIKTYISGDNVLFLNGGVSNLIPRSNSSTKSSVMFLMVFTTTPVSSASCVKVRSKQRLRTC